MLCIQLSAGGVIPLLSIRRVLGQKSSLLQRIFQNIFQIEQAPANRAAHPADPHALGLGNFFFADAENVMSIDTPGLDGRELGDGRIEGGPILPGLQDLLRGRRRVSHVGLKAGIGVQGALAMILLAALVAVTQAASDGEGGGDLVADLQGGVLFQVRIIFFQNDGFHVKPPFRCSAVDGLADRNGGRRGAAPRGASPHLWPRWSEVGPGQNKCAHTA